VFHDEIDQALNPELLTVPVGGERLPLNELYAQAAGRYPRAEAIRFRRLPLQEGQALEMNVTEAGKYTLVYLDPYTGRVIGQRQRYTYLVDWLLRLHYSLFLGEAGEMFVALLAVALVGSVATGLFIYRKYIRKVLLFRVPLAGQNWRVLSSGLHRIVGVWSLLFNLLIAVTGFYLHYPTLAAALQGQAEPEPVSRPFRLSLSLDSLVARGTRALPGLVPRSINLPARPGGAIVLYGSVPGSPLLSPYGNWVAFDALTGAVSEVYDVRRQSPEARLDSALGTLHFGYYGGIPVKVLYALLGLAPGFLSVTGALLWWRRKRNRSRTSRRTARQPAPVAH
jgi:uncharacterized iron-regulated membrane protein